MVVVSDTSPINYLTLINKLEVLKDLFGEVLIPPAVARELSNEHAPDSVRSIICNPPEWLKISAPSSEMLSKAAAGTPRLGTGELEAIALALDVHAALLLTDERRATRAARRAGLRVTPFLVSSSSVHVAALFICQTRSRTCGAQAFECRRNSWSVCFLSTRNVRNAKAAHSPNHLDQN